MNSVRFAFKGEWYEKDDKAFFRWLDENIKWARDAGIYLVLDLHVPIGGFWLDPTSDKVDFRLWSEPAIQQRNLRMWAAIASRYRNEPVIAAYDVLNEPVTSDKDGTQWRVFAQRLVDEIRAVDRNHMIIIGKIYGTDRSYSTAGIESQFLVADNNVMYDFHFYEPIHYTHQYAAWLPRPIQEGGVYPDETVLIPTGHQRYITSLTQVSPHRFDLKASWQKFSLAPLTIQNPKIKMGLPVFQVKGSTAGIVFFDNIEITASNLRGLSETVVNEPLSKLTVWDWWGWNNPHVGRNGLFERVVDDGVEDSYSLSIAGVRGAEGYSGWSSDMYWFQVKQGYTYSMTGYLKATDPDAMAYFDIAFYGDSPDSDEKSFLSRNREYLEWEFMKLYQFGIEHNVPMSVMEFGLTHECFTRGGENWVEDVLDIFLEHNVSFAYWDYHSDRMGVYFKDSEKPPGNPNLALIKAFQGKLKQ